MGIQWYTYIIMYHINMIIYSYIGIYWEFMGLNGNPYYIILYILTKRQGFKKCHDQGWFLCCCPNMWNSLLSQWYTLWQSNMACWKICNLVPWFSHQRHPSIKGILKLAMFDSQRVLTNIQVIHIPWKSYENSYARMIPAFYQTMSQPTP